MRTFGLLGLHTKIVLIATLGLAATRCADLPNLQPNTCGNGVIEEARGEQCDLSEDETLGDKIKCGDPSDVVRGCHYVCSRTSTDEVKCPVGWGCSDDGICQFASGGYVETEDSPIDLLPYSKLQLADVDGDGNADLVTTSNTGVSVHFAKKDGSFSTSFDYGVQNVASATVIGKLDADAASDLVVSSLAGPIVLRGQRDHTLAPVIFSRITPTAADNPAHVQTIQVAPIRLPSCVDIGTPTTAIALIAFDGGLDLVVPALEEHYVVRAPSYDGRPPSRMIIRELDDDPTTEEIVIAVPGAMRAHVLRFGCKDDRAKIEQLQAVELPAPVASIGSVDVAESTDNVFVTHVDGLDPYLDLLIAVENTQSTFAPRVAVAQGLGHGTFAAAKIDDRFCVLSGFCEGMGLGPEPSPIVVLGREWPLAAGDIDGDGVADYVGLGGIYLTDHTTGMLVEVGKPRRLDYWTSAVIEDLNGDGFPDVAAASTDSLVLGIELALSSVIGNTTRRAYETQSKLVATLGLPGALRTGDFDGDGLHDLAFLEGGLLSESTLSVVYGGTFTRISMGNPGHLASLSEGDLTGDGVDDLLMSMNEGDASAPVWSVGVLFGTEERRLISPVPLGQLAASTTIEAFPGSRALVGKFLGDGQLDLLVFDDSQLMMLPGDGKGRFALEEPAARHWPIGALLPGIEQFRPDCVHFSTAAVDPATRETDDQLIAVYESNCAFVDTAAGGPGTGPMGSELADKGHILVFGGNTPVGLPRIAKLELPTDAGQLAGAWVLDLDGDPRPELVLAKKGVATDVGVPGIRPGASSNTSDALTAGLIVYWNVSVDFSVPLSEDPVIAFEDHVEIPLSTAGSVPLAAVAVNADGDAAKEIALLVAQRDENGTEATASVHLIDFDSPTTYRFLPDLALKRSISTLGSPQLATTDVNRDGLDDLIYGDGAEVFIYRAKTNQEP